jgi:serine/threonine-protein kinase
VLRDGAPVTLAPRLFDTLLHLVANHERLVEKSELIAAVWGRRTVEEANLSQAIFALRKALQTGPSDDNIIVTAPGRGYRCGVPVMFEADPGNGAGADTANSHGADAGTPAAMSMPWWQPNRALAAPIVIMALLCVALWQSHSRAPKPVPVAAAPFEPPPRSVAVLAFTNLSGDPAQEYFSEGLSEELIDALGHIDALRVSARLSSFSFKGKQVSIGEIARQLNVGSVLEGSVRRNGQQLRITAQLIDARSGYQIWSKHFDPDENDILKVQTEIATAVATALQVTMVGDDATKLSLGGTSNPKAFDAYLRGMKLHNEGTRESVKQARVAFEAALALDPTYALAHVRHISCLILTAQGLASQFSGDPGSKELIARALGEAEQVALLAPDLGAAHTILGNALFMSGNFVRAAAEHSRARALAPSDPWVNTMYGLFQSIMGHSEEAINAAKLATDLDPISAEAYFNRAAIFMMTRRPSDALVALQRAKVLGSSNANTLYVTYMAELEEGDASSALRDCSAGQGDPLCLAIAYHAIGQQASAETQLKKLMSIAGDDGASSYARIYAQWGQFNDALKWLETSYNRHDPALAEIKASWIYDPIRDTPRFNEIERRMEFPP